MICEKHNEEKVTYKNGKKTCLTCNKIAQREWWQKNKLSQQERVKQNRNRLKDIILDIKKTKMCAICCETNPMVLEFDHIRDKTECVSELARIGIKKERIEEEISKCRVLCSNCHQIKTHIEKQTYIYKKFENDERYKQLFIKIIDMIKSEL